MDTWLLKMDAPTHRNPCAKKTPSIEPATYDGNPETFHKWLTSFCLLIESEISDPIERLLYLERYTTGEAQDAIKGYFIACTSKCYEAAISELKEQFGNPYLLVNCYRQRLIDWEYIQKNDGPALRQFVRFLLTIHMVMEKVHKSILNLDCPFFMLEKIIVKLPWCIRYEWAEKIVEYQEKYGEDKQPSFLELHSFLKLKAYTLCHPINDILNTLIPTPTQQPESPQSQSPQSQSPPSQSPQFQSPQSQSPQSQSSLDSSDDSECTYCSLESHNIQMCDNFQGLSTKEQKYYITTRGLCFSCLEHGHLSKDCEAPSKCSICHKRHPSSLHRKVPYYQSKRSDKSIVKAALQAGNTQTEVKYESPIQPESPIQDKHRNHNSNSQHSNSDQLQYISDRIYAGKQQLYIQTFPPSYDISSRQFPFIHRYYGNHYRALAGSVTAGMHPAVGFMQSY